MQESWETGQLKKPAGSEAGPEKICLVFSQKFIKSCSPGSERADFDEFGWRFLMKTCCFDGRAPTSCRSLAELQ